MSAKRKQSNLRVWIAVVFSSVGVTLGALGVGTLTVAFPAAAKAAPDTKKNSDAGGALASRDFCGRIVILYNGAGVRPGFESPAEAIDANAIIKAFILDSPVLVPSVIFSSDPLVTKGKRVSDLRERTKIAEIVPSSKTSFQKALSNYGTLAGIKLRLAQSTACSAIAKPGEDVSKYLKVELIIASHSSREAALKLGEVRPFRGVPIWAEDQDGGMDFEHTINHGPVLTETDFQLLYAIFPEALFQTLISACDSANIGEMIAPASTLPSTVEPRYCYAGLVARDLIAPVVGNAGVSEENDFKSVIGSHLQEHSERGVWKGSSSLYSLSLAILDYYRSNARINDSFRDAGSMFYVDRKVLNPFRIFAVNSLDTLVAKRRDVMTNEQGYTKAKMSPDTQRLVREIEQLDDNLPVSVGAEKLVRSEIRFQSVILKMQKQLMDYLKPQPGKWSYGREIFLIIEKAEADGDPTLMRLYEKMVKTYEKMGDPKAYEFGTKNGRIVLNESETVRFWAAVRELKENTQDLDKFKQLLKIEGERQGEPDRPGHPTVVRSGSEELSKHVATFHQSFLHAYFPDLVRDALANRVQTVKEYLREIASRANPDGSSPEVQQVRDQMDCLTKIPVGPAFDRKFLLPKLPKTQPKVSGGASDNTQVYLLPPDEQR